MTGDQRRQDSKIPAHCRVAINYLNSVHAGAFTSDLAALAGTRPAVFASLGAGVSLVSAVVHVRYAARFRQTHDVRTRFSDEKRRGSADHGAA